MPIQTNSLITITPAERDRVNAALSAGDAAASQLTAALAQVSSLQGNLAAANARIAELEALLAQPHRGGLYVDGKYLRCKGGQEVQIRGIELMYGNSSASAPETSVQVCRTFGANAVAPLYQPWIQSGYTDTAAGHAALDLGLIRAAAAAHLQAARAAGVVVLFNPDHIPASRRQEFLFSPATVALLQGHDNVILSLGTESYETTQAEWFTNRLADIAAVRAAGFTCPLKISSPQGGRAPRWALQRGAELLAADPLHNLVFTWQAYWKTVTSGWQYSHDQGFPSAGTAGALECAAEIAASGLCFIVGLDGRDNIGDTPYAELAAALHAGGVGWQWWALSGDSFGNGLAANALSSTPAGDFGAPVKALLTAQSVLPTL